MQFTFVRWGGASGPAAHPQRRAGDVAPYLAAPFHSLVTQSTRPPTRGTKGGVGLVLRGIWREGLGMHPWRPEEVEEVFCRSSGPGGQHVNKVSTAVTLRHLPTGLSVRVSTSRSQARNRAEAARLLAVKLEAAAAAARQSRLAEASKNRRRRAKRSKGTKRRLVESKRRRGETKQLRKKIS